MTEQEFRDALKRSVGHTGLSSDRQTMVLAGMKGEARKVCRWSRMKIVLAAGLALLLMTGVASAVAGGWSLLDLSGKPLQTRQVDSDQRMLELRDKYLNGVAVSVYKWDEADGEYRGVLASDMKLKASSLEKLQQWVATDGTLPWPQNIPGEYSRLASGEALYVCGAEGELRLHKQEETEDGYIVSLFQIPADSRFMCGYTIFLSDHERRHLTIWVQLASRQDQFGIPVENGSTYTDLNVEGMLEAAAFESATQTRVALRKEIQPALEYLSVGGLPDGAIRKYKSGYDCLEIWITGQESPADLLAIFGLTAQ